MRGKPLAVATLILLATAVVRSEPASAQDRALELDFRGGGVVPTGDLSDLMETSASFGVGLNVPVGDRVDVRLQGASDLYKGREITAGVGSGRSVADLTLTHLQAGLNLDLVDPGDGAWSLDVYALGGVTAANSDQQDYGTGSGGIVRVDVADAWPVVTGGSQIGYRVSPRVDLFVSGEVNYMLADADETVAYTRLGPIDEADGFGAQASFPLSVGVKLNFPE